MNDLTPESLTKDAGGSAQALFSAKQVSVAAFLGGPLGGGWLMFRNFAALGDQAQKKVTLFGSLFLTALLAIGGSWLPTDFPDRLIPPFTVGICAAWYYFKLKPAFEKHLEGDGAQASWWNAMGLSLAALLASMGLFIIVAVLLPVLPVNHIKDGSNVIYYEGDATRENAESLARFFRESGLSDPDSFWELTLQFPKNDPRRAVIKFPYFGEVEGTPAHGELKALAALLDEEMYLVKEVEIHLQNAFGLTTYVVRNE